MKIDRLVSIIMLLLEKERIAAQELADMFEVSPRTIYRDIDTINMAGIPILSTPGVSGGFEIMPQYKMDKKVFSTSDLAAILMGLSGLSDVIRGEEVVNALAKVKSFIPAEKAKEIALKTNQVYIDLSPWLGKRNIEKSVEIIKTAMQEGRLLSFTYSDRYGNTTTRTAEPYQLVLKGSHWYWQGYCLLRNDFRLFKLSRSTNLKTLKERFLPREFQNPQLDFTDFVAGLQTIIKIRIHNSLADDVLDYCSDDDILNDGDEHCIVNFPFIENDYYYNMLLSFGAKCECLAPENIRQEMRRRISDMAIIYEH